MGRYRNPGDREGIRLGSGGFEHAADTRKERFVLKGENIICFAKDWSEDPTSNNHVMRLLAEENRVLWLNSIAMRRPNFADSGDIAKVWQKLKSFFQGAKTAANNLWIATPIVLPFPHSKIATALNAFILRATISYYRRKLEMRQFQLWTFLPNAVEYVGKFGESLVVYYCTDEWSKFTYLEGEKMSAMERRLMARADVCFMTANLLLEKKKNMNANTFLASHGVDHAHFEKALAGTTVTPPDIAALPHPIIGFFGLIHEWLDLDLLAKIARTHADWSIVLIGKSVVDVSRLESLPNIHLLGRRPYEALPDYCRAFDVGIIPFAVNEMTLNINPIKLREYLSAGLPVVSTDLPEVKYYGDEVYIAHGHDEFISKIERAIREDSGETRRRRSVSMREETWEARVDAVGIAIDTVRNAKLRKPLP
jgi:glycosyltransferase involved in cell wall biosynthesis